MSIHIQFIYITYVWYIFKYVILCPYMYIYIPILWHRKLGRLYIYIHISTYSTICIYTYPSIHTHDICTYTYIYAYTHDMHLYKHVCKYTYNLYTYIHINTYTYNFYTYVHTYTYTCSLYICIHTYIHTHVQTISDRRVLGAAQEISYL